MGAKHSTKMRRGMSSSNNRDLKLVSGSDDLRVVSASNFDEETITDMKVELEDTPEKFVLNNLLMSVMFFDNFEKEKQKLIHSTRTQMEKDLNPSLLKNEKNECIIPDVIFDEVNKHVTFRPIHGRNKHTSEPLVAKRFFVVNDTIEVIEMEDLTHYSVIDKPGYQVRVEESKKHGFVKLKHVELQASDSSTNTPKKDDDIYHDTRPGPSSAFTDSSDDYEYTTITGIKTPKPLDVDCSQRRDTLPDTCFTTRKIKKLDDNSSSTSFYSEDDDPEPVDEETLYETVSYISSKAFMEYFQSSVFPNSLGRALGFNLDDIQAAVSIPGMIFCNMGNDENHSVPCEVIPSVRIQWPVKQTYEFQLRDSRPTLIDREGHRYRWPTDEMIIDLKSFKCVLIPKGCFPKRGENIDSEIEWEIAFPRAERYLDTRMSHAQVRCLLFILSLYRTYIEPVTKQHGLLVEHIRHHLYWECESNFKDWPEHRLGTKLLMVLDKLHERLGHSHLSNFFIKQKNVFENIPNKYLKSAQKVFHDILQSPVVYFIVALRNLRYTSGKFFPPLDFKQLYQILAGNAVLRVNRSLVDESSRPPNFRRRKRTQQYQENESNISKKEEGWKRKKERINREKFLKIRDKKEKEKNLANPERTDSVNSIDLKWECEERFDNFKIRELLKFFINHFIEIAKKCRKLSTERQSLLYLKQAFYLAKVLERCGLEQDSKEFLEIIAKEEEHSKKIAVTESMEQVVPSTPKRNSALFTWDLKQQVNPSININLNRLNSTFNSTGLSTSPQSMIKVKRLPSNMKHKSAYSQHSEPSSSRKSVNFSDSFDIKK